MEWWKYGILIGNICIPLASVLGWIVKLRWSKEFVAKNDATIRSKNAQIATIEREIKSIKDSSEREIKIVRDSKEDIIKEKDAHIAVMQSYFTLFSSEKLKEAYISSKTQLEELLSKAQKDIQDERSLTTEQLSRIKEEMNVFTEEMNKLRVTALTTVIQKSELMLTEVKEMREMVRHQFDNIEW